MPFQYCPELLFTNISLLRVMLELSVAVPEITTGEFVLALAAGVLITTVGLVESVLPTEKLMVVL